MLPWTDPPGPASSPTTGADGRLGAADCEALGSGWLAQPVNAVSSLAYLVVAALIVTVVVTHRSGRLAAAGRETLVFAAGLAAIGVGSVAFHGPQPPGARFVHDLPILVTAWFILWCNASDLAGRSPRPWRAFVAGVVVAAGVTALAPDVGVGAAAGVVLLAAGTEVGVRALGRRSAPRSSVLVVGGVVAGGLWWAGRTASPLCAPESWLQPHALWHAATAGLLGLWWASALGPVR